MAMGVRLTKNQFLLLIVNNNVNREINWCLGNLKVMENYLLASKVNLSFEFLLRFDSNYIYRLIIIVVS